MTPTVDVIVPWRGDCPHRAAALTWVADRFITRFPDWRFVLAPAPAGAWVKAAAVNPAVWASVADIVVLSDADVWCDAIAASVDAVAAGAAWAIPHGSVHRLTEDASARVMAGARWEGQPLDRAAYRGIAGGGMVAAPRATLVDVPLDPRFAGWGQEDEAHALALDRLAGPAWRGDGHLIHLWHPPQPRRSGRFGSEASWRLRGRYLSAAGDADAMRGLLEEGLSHAAA